MTIQLFLSVQMTSSGASRVIVYLCTIRMFGLNIYCLGIDAGHDYCIHSK